MKNTKRSIMSSAIALLLCFSMLLGATYAWFTDSASSAGNIIQSGNLDIQMHWSENLVDWNEVNGPIFTYDNWEPGYTDVKYVKVKNVGSLAFKWQLNIEAEGDVGELAEVIDVYYISPAEQVLTSLDNLTSVGVLADVVKDKTSIGGNLLPANTVTDSNTPADYLVGETVIAIAFHMDEEAGNKYQDKSVGDGFTVSLVATQLSFESDSFGNEYDVNAEWPNNIIVNRVSVSADIDVTADNKVANAVSMTAGEAGSSSSATVPQGVKVEEGTDKLTFTMIRVDNSVANVVLDEDEAMLSMDVHIDGVAKDNEVVMEIKSEALLPKYLNMGNYRFYHVEDGATVEMKLLENGTTPVHNNYEYDPATGDVVLHLKSFSVVALVAGTSVWNGGYDYSWYIDPDYNTDAESGGYYRIANADQLAGFSAIVGGMNGQTQYSFEGKIVKLLTDVNLNNKLFYPIGYFNSTGSYQRNVYTDANLTSDLNSFKGTFDGNGNVISNFYQNTWDMKGDYNDGYPANSNYYKDGMGLFGYVLNGTVKNLTVDNFSSDGEFTPTGVIAAYACNATFENIAIRNCNPRVYNTGNGGIVGIGGNSSDPDSYKLTFKNITVDNTNKITALWGSWDVACGGLVGMFRGDGHAYMTNCHVAAQIDVYNDVCGNYQYYWYRYAGMLIGTNKNMITDENGYTVPETEKFHADNCTVHFGDWNDYYYCELVANSLASYTHDHQFSRLTEVKEVKGMTITPLEGEAFTVPESGRYNYVVVNGAEGTDNATCYHFVDGKVHNHDDYNGDGVEDKEKVNDEYVFVENNRHIYLPFNQLFTGYGWGVKHIPIYNDATLNPFKGVTVLDVQYAYSDAKFDAIIENGTKFGMNITVTLDQIFKALDNPQYAIDIEQVQVTVSPINGETNSTVEATYTPNKTDWTKGTISFIGAGYAKITITDYNYCIPETVVVVVGSDNPDLGFDGADDEDIIHGGSDVIEE